jgi:hypothetical protein
MPDFVSDFLVSALPIIGFLIIFGAVPLYAVLIGSAVFRGVDQSFARKQSQPKEIRLPRGVDKLRSRVSVLPTSEYSDHSDVRPVPRGFPPGTACRPAEPELVLRRL